MGTGKNLLLAFLNYSAAFRAGEVKAADELSRLLKTEHINNKYAPVLLPVLKHLAAQNKAPAQKFLGDCFLNGYGTRKDKKQAFYYYELSAGQKFPDSILQLASFYMTGEVVGKDLQKAIKLLLPLAGKNHAAAQYKLGLCYKDNGNWNDSKKWLAKAAQSGMKDAQKPLAFVEGKIQEEIDRENQIRWAMERQKYQEQYASSSGNRCADCGGSGAITNRFGRFRCAGCNGTGSPGYGTDYFDSNGRRQRSAMDQQMGRFFGTGGGIGGIFGN